MFYLYMDNTRKLIDKSNEEKDIIETMGECLAEDINSRFLVVEKTDKGDNLKAFIRNYDDYINYIGNYMLRQESCVELKNEITKDVKVKKKRPKQ